MVVLERLVDTFAKHIGVDLSLHIDEHIWPLQ